MMNVFDKFLMGETTGINWCFENRHFINRLDENGISREYVVDCLMMEEPISYETTTNRQNKQYQSDKKKEIEKKRLKALSKRKW